MSPQGALYARRGGDKVHVAGNARHPDAGPSLARCGAELWGSDYLARFVPVGDRCRARACAEAWPAVLRLIPGTG